MTEILEAKAEENPEIVKKGPYDQIIVFGDSITQQACSQDKGFAFIPALQNAFIRRLDVINRGFSGYNTSQALNVFPSWMPEPSQAHIRFMRRLSPTSSTGQHVPLAQFYHNLKAIILHPSMRAHTSPPSNSSASTKIILVTPPPVDEYQLEDINPEIQRTAEHTRKYVDACLQLSKDMAIPCLDLWSIMMKKAGWEGKEGEELVGCKKRERSKVLNDLLSDGLHFNPAAYKILFEATLNLIKEKWPDENPEPAPFVHPWWRTLRDQRTMEIALDDGK